MYSIQRADSRGGGDFGWLKTRYSFSFSHYYNPAQMQFGALRVLNDDLIDPGMGFDFHSHDNMEIVTIPLSGALLHKDTIGNREIVSEGEIQVMSAGSGVTHSEWNASNVDPVELLQVWVLPDTMNVVPRYDQMTCDLSEANTWKTLISPYPGSEGLWIYQDAWFSRARFQEGVVGEYALKDSAHGVYLFVISGELEFGDDIVYARDSIEVSGEAVVSFVARQISDVLIIEVPLID